jgi:ADP-ribosylation factor-like protein 4
LVEPKESHSLCGVRNSSSPISSCKTFDYFILDVGGQEKLRPLWRSYTRCTDGIIFVIDSVDLERMEEAKMELMRTAKCPDNQV